MKLNQLKHFTQSVINSFRGVIKTSQNVQGSAFASTNYMGRVLLGVVPRSSCNETFCHFMMWRRSSFMTNTQIPSNSQNSDLCTLRSCNKDERSTRTCGSAIRKQVTALKYLFVSSGDNAILTSPSARYRMFNQFVMFH